MIQNTEEWLEIRRSKIGASDANIIMGCSRFKTRDQLLIEKIDPSKEKKKDNTFITDKGHRYESIIRSVVEIDLGIDFTPIVAISENLIASLDGYNEETKTILECKYVGAKDFEIVKSGSHLEQYYPQIQHQLLVTGARECILAVMTDDKKIATVRVPPDKAYITKKLKPALNLFWSDWKNVNVDSDYSENETLYSQLESYKEKTEQFKKLEEEINELKNLIFPSVSHEVSTCRNYKISQYETKARETFDYKKYFESIQSEPPREFMKLSKPSQIKKISFD